MTYELPPESPDEAYARRVRPMDRNESPGRLVDGVWREPEGPGTGLPWFAEALRLNLLASAENHDHLGRQYGPYGTRPSEFGVGLCLGQAEAYREVARTLIRWAPWRE